MEEIYNSDEIENSSNDDQQYQERYNADTELLVSLLRHLQHQEQQQQNLTVNDDDNIKNTKIIHCQQLQHIIVLIQQYPKFFLHFMEQQSNDKNPNWDILIALLQQLSSCTCCSTSSNAYNDDKIQQDSNNNDSIDRIIYSNSNNNNNNIYSNDEESSLLITFLTNTVVNQERGWTLLHWLCSHGGTPINVFEALIHSFINSTSTNICYMSTTSNHSSNHNNGKRKTLSFIFTQFILQQDTYIGDTCLHLLCRNACQFSSTKLQLLLSVLQNHHFVDDNNNNQDLQQQRLPPQAAAMTIRNRLGGTILHAATIGAAVYDVLVMIVSIYPPILHISSKDGIYPITALWYSYSDTIPGYMSIVRILECGGDDGVSLQNTNPSFQRFWIKVQYLAIQHFLHSDHCPDHLRYDDNNNDDINEQRKVYMLHGLLHCNVPINMIKVCLCLYPITATAVDGRGNTPLHILIQNRQYHRRNGTKDEYDAIQACIDAYPFAASIANHQHHVPLQLAILNKIPINSGIYDLLVNAGPNTLQYRCYNNRTPTSFTDTTDDVNTEDDITGFYPYQLAAIQNTTPLHGINTIFYLFRQQPSLLRRQ